MFPSATHSSLNHFKQDKSSDTNTCCGNSSHFLWVFIAVFLPQLWWKSTSGMVRFALLEARALQHVLCIIMLCSSLLDISGKSWHEEAFLPSSTVFFPTALKIFWWSVPLSRITLYILHGGGLLRFGWDFRLQCRNVFTSMVQYLVELPQLVNYWISWLKENELPIILRPMW